MLYKSIINTVGVVAVIVAVMFTGCVVDLDDPGDKMGSGRGNDINSYRTTVIGTQTWMAENLDYAIAGSACYDSLKSNCDKYGRLYTWDAANRACPVGWHLPSDDEWTTLVDFIGDNAGTKLKSTTGWITNSNGTDDYEFSALPGGSGNGVGFFIEGRSIGRWWSATERDDYDGRAWSRYIRLQVGWDSYDKTHLFSVRCVED